MTFPLYATGSLIYAKNGELIAEVTGTPIAEPEARAEQLVALANRGWYAGRTAPMEVSQKDSNGND